MFLHTPTDADLVVGGEQLAHTIYRADSTLAKAVGVMGRRGVPADSALAFEFDRAYPQAVHMLGVREPITVWWVRDGELVEAQTLEPWTGTGSARADLVVELPADVEASVGETVELHR